MKRRSFLTGALAAPVLITTPGLLMPVKPRVTHLRIARGVVFHGKTGTTYEWQGSGSFSLEFGEVYYIEVEGGGRRYV